MQTCFHKYCKNRRELSSLLIVTVDVTAISLLGHLHPSLVFFYNHGFADTSKASESGADGQKLGALPHNLRSLSHQILKVLKDFYTYHLH